MLKNNSIEFHTFKPFSLIIINEKSIVNYGLLNIKNNGDLIFNIKMGTHKGTIKVETDNLVIFHDYR